MKEYISQILKEAAELKTKAVNDEIFVSSIEKVATALVSCLQQNKKILVAGNGGSAADAQHFAAELVCKYEKDRAGFSAFALTTDVSILTAWSNDHDFEGVFARQINALGSVGDVFFGISTSGNSKNVIKAIEMAKEKGLVTVGLTGNGGGKIKEFCDYTIVVPATVTARIQEIGLTVIHILCGLIETQIAV